MTYFTQLWEAAQATIHAHPDTLHHAEAALRWLQAHATVEDAFNFLNKLRTLDWLLAKWRAQQNRRHSAVAPGQFERAQPLSQQVEQPHTQKSEATAHGASTPCE